jgi:hypothetical protein
MRSDLAQRLAVKKGEFHSLGLVLGYDYPESPVVVPDGRPLPEEDLTTYHPSAHPGARLPHAWLPHGTSVYDLLGDGFAVLHLTPDGDAVALSDAAALRGVPLRVLDLSHLPQLRALYDADLVLVRPDQHVAWRGGPEVAADAVLDAVLGARVAVHGHS